MRVSEIVLFQSVIGDLQRGRRAELDVLEQISSGKQLQRPSDDPPKFIQIAGLKDTQVKIDQRQRNIDSGLGHMRATETSLSTAVDILNRVKELGLQMRNDTNSATDRRVAALEIGQNINQMADVANAKNGDIDLFSGFSSRGRATGVPQIFPTTVTNGVSDTLTLTVDGVASGTIDLTALATEAFTGPQLATRLQAQINADPTLSGVGKAVTVSFDTDHVVITSNAFGAASSVEVTGGTARSLIGFNGGSTTSGGSPFSRVGTTSADTANTGTALISQGTVTDSNTTLIRDLEFRFTNGTTFDVVDSDTGDVISTGLSYTSGAAIDVVGFRVAIDGVPATGDVFSLKAGYAYVGDGGESGVEVGDGRTTKVALAGSRVFQNTTADVMGAMTKLQHALLANNNNDQNFASQGIAAKNTVVSAAGGTLEFNVGANGTTSVVTVPPGTTLTGLRDAINATAGIEVKASIISDGPVGTPHNLVLTPTNSGADRTITITQNDTTLNYSFQDDKAGIKKALEEIELAFDQVIEAVGEIGARQSRLEGTQQGLEELNVLVPELLSQLEDTDLVAAISELTLQRFALEAAARTANTVFDTSLLNFLR